MRQELSLLPIDLTLKFPRALGATINLHFYDESGVDIDIDGDTIELVVRDKIGGTQMLTATGTIVDHAAGLAQIALSDTDLTPTDTDSLIQWVYVITRTHAGVPMAWWGGAFEIHQTAL